MLKFIKNSTWLTYKRTLCHEVERQRRLYGNTLSLASLKNYICVGGDGSDGSDYMETGGVMDGRATIVCCVQELICLLKKKSLVTIEFNLIECICF